MLDPSWALTRPLLWLALAAMLALLVFRTVRKDRREYRRFKRYRSTLRRQAMFRSWLRESFLTLGGLAVAILLLAGAYIAPLLAELARWPVLRDIRGFVSGNVGITIGLVVVAVLGLGLLTLVGARAARKEGEEVVAIGDIRSMLPHNRQELRLTALLAINAGVVEELLFRLALPALIFGASGSAIAAVLGSVLLFGALHLYQGLPGVVATTVVGALTMAVYVVSGTIAVPIVLHALFDLRTLVLIPVLVMRVHRIDGKKHPFIPRPPAKKPVEAAAPVSITPATAAAPTAAAAPAVVEGEPV